MKSNRGDTAEPDTSGWTEDPARTRACLHGADKASGTGRAGRARYVLWTAFGIVFVAALPVCYYLSTHGYIILLDEWIQAHPLAGVFVFAIAYVVISVLLLAPSELTSVTAGVVFGFWGVPLVIVSAVVAAVISFLLSRYLLRAKVKAFVAKRPLLRAIDAAVEAQTWQFCLLLRLNPLIGFNFQNYIFGVTGIGLVVYVLTTFFGIIPLTAVFVYLGTVGRTLAIEGQLGTSNSVLLCFGLIPTAALIYMVGRKTKQKLREMSAEPVTGRACRQTKA